MVIEDYDEVYQLWSLTKGIGLSGADTRENIDAYLRRNKDLSFVCEKSNRIIGAILCGHDGRRGFIHHLVIDEEYRRSEERRVGKECRSRNRTCKKISAKVFRAVKTRKYSKVPSFCHER